MKYMGLDGREHTITFEKYKKKRNNVSSGHKKARELLSQAFPSDPIFEEVTLPGINPAVYVDFFIPSKDIIVEVDGEQHRVYNKFFHKNKANFRKAKKNDKAKQEWCDNNDLLLMRLDTNGTEQQWKEQISKREARASQDDT